MPDDGFALSGLHKDIFMTVNLKNRNFLKLLDYTPTEIQYLIDLAIELKTAKKAGRERQTLVGKKYRADLRKNLNPYPLCL
ncbi:ornithine carbamoyltransferase [Citrobacter freundii]|nr:ornithine carbamoyltransferase [Citrobacter freundii]